MKSHFLLGAALGALALAPAYGETNANSAVNNLALRDVIIITGQSGRLDTLDEVTPEEAISALADASALAARVPGGAHLANGSLSGQFQYRGLFGERLNLRVDGQRFASGGPNLMDPVFHYAPIPLVAALLVDRGISPVSAGPGLGGGADIVFKRIDYRDGDVPQWGYDLSAMARSVNDGTAIGGVAGASTNRWRFNLLGSIEQGGDVNFPGGMIAGSGHHRDVFGLSSGLRTGLGEFSLDVRRQNTGATGNAPFPMDIIYFDSDFARLGYSRNWGSLELSATVFASDIAHGMNNFAQRPAPSAMAQRETYADATTRGADIKFAHPAWGGLLSMGGDFEQNTHDVIITNPNNAAFFVTPFPDVEKDRAGLFAQWLGAWGAIETELGARVDWHDQSAGQAKLGPALPMGPNMLANAFNVSDRHVDEVTTDLAARLWYDLNDEWRWRATLARKNRMPNYIQRYGWLPINASGGLADGNIYIGDLSLKPETAFIAEVGLDYASAQWGMRPTLYWRHIDDYIQGVAFDATPGVINSPVEMIARMNGDPTPLRWSNVEARITGFDLDGYYNPRGPLRFDATLSVMRGERGDVDDNLYRISPDQLRVTASWEETEWALRVETVMAAEQDRVSRTNDEEATPGYVVLKAAWDWQVQDRAIISLGVENLLDHQYREHLAGYNRNGFGDVGLGQRLPGAGRGAFIRLNWSR